MVRGGSLLSTGVNRYRNDPALVQIGDVSYHAEAVVLSKAGDARGATIYIARIAKSGVLAMAKPCARCQELLLENGIGTILYTSGFTEVQKLRARYVSDQDWTEDLPT